MFYLAPNGSRVRQGMSQAQMMASPAEEDDLLTAARSQADAIRAKAEVDATRIVRDAQERADLLVKQRLEQVEGEMERLRVLRRNIGTLLESSVSALRVVEHLMSSPDAARDANPVHRFIRTLQTRHGLATALAVGLTMAAAFVAGARYADLSRPAPLLAHATSHPGDRLVERPAAVRPEVGPATPSVSPAATTGNAQTLAGPPAAETRPLTVMLSAERQCWVRATIDGTEIMERLLEPAQELVVQARDRVLLRVGDAGALSATINGKRAVPFGRPGEVITRQITLQNYARWLTGD
jgi:F0F1-type ATP synthase membrane subunit b/b'